MKIPKVFSIAVLSLAAAGLAAAGLAAEPDKASQASRITSKLQVSMDLPAAAAHPKGTRINAIDAYGTTAITRISLLSYAFQGNDPYNDNIVDDGNSYRYFTDGLDSFIFSANISIPAGAQIVGMGFDNCDNTALGTMTLYLRDRFGDHDSTVLGTVASTDSSSCGFNGASLTPYDHDDNIDHVFELYVGQDIQDNTLKFRSAYVDYVQRLSPAPGVATFNDVPTGDFAFQYIEALVASEITGGCSVAPPLYCPDNFVTRRQMAIFIAKALGLHWPF